MKKEQRKPRSLDGLVWKLFWFLAGLFFFVCALGNARDRGFVEGCEFTRQSMIDAIKEWEKSE